MLPLEILKGTDWNTFSPQIFKIIGIKANSNASTSGDIEIQLDDISYTDDEINNVVNQVIRGE